MATFSTILLLLFAIFLTFFVLPFVFLLATSIIWNGAPFVPVPSRAVPGIVEALFATKGFSIAKPVHAQRAVVYDMGCGDGRVLCSAVRSNPNVRAVGIECALLPYALARIRARNLPIEIRRKDFFQEDLSQATHVVTYLFPELMARVEQKLAVELKPGTRVVAIDFPLPTWKPIEVIKQKVPGLKRGTNLYIYQL
ncbi:MAG: class I SAM-dependent methyltransferase [Patescibacteria group bacterium]